MMLYVNHFINFLKRHRKKFIMLLKLFIFQKVVKITIIFQI